MGELSGKAPHMSHTLSFDFILTPRGIRENARLLVDDNGFIRAIEDADGDSRDGYFALPGMPNAHSHCFQRALAGYGERALGRDSFWDWREHMYRLANRIGPEDLHVIAKQAFSEMLAAGYTSVGEFHYLHHLADGSPSTAMAEAVIAAAAHTGIRLTMLPVLYMRGGFDLPLQATQGRFAHRDLDDFFKLVEALGDVPCGLAPHSLRAVPAELLEEMVSAGRSLLGEGFPLHIHVSEQIAEVTECKARFGQGPVDLLADSVELGDDWNLVHATHASTDELQRVAEAGARVVLCPLTEAYLGDGIFPACEFRSMDGDMAIGSDSDVRIDAVEELRMLEYSQRLGQQLRGRLADETGLGGPLWTLTARAGADALDIPAGAIEPGCLADLAVLSADAPPLQGPPGARALDALLTAGGRENISDVYVGGKRLVQDGVAPGARKLAGEFASTVRSLMEE